MTVKEILINSAIILGDNDLVSYLKDGVCENSSVTVNNLSILKTAYKLVLEEIASEYLDIVNTETFSVNNQELEYSNFTYSPIRIISVLDTSGQKTNAKIYPCHIKTDLKSVTVKYAYIPKFNGLDDINPFENTVITERVLVYGICTEYNLIKGNFDLASVYHTKYYDALRGALKQRAVRRIRPRKWL